MTLTPGTRLGPYEVQAAIGAGGMGEVYRARDTQLKREVALKVLPADVATDPDRLARFQREAELLAALNHPHIAQIYGLVESGPATGGGSGSTRAVVMELVEGETLAARIARGPAVTQAGVILGTAAYMSPEQTRGAAVDKRADIWAFGVVVFEMLTGRACFPGDSVTDVLAAVVRAEPDWNALPAATPRHVREVLARCLCKDPKQRLRDIGDARLELLDLPAHDSGAERVVPHSPRASGRRWLLAAGGLLTLVLCVIGLAIRQYPGWLQPKASAPVVRFAINIPTGQQLARSGSGSLAPFDVSPDGSHIVYAALQGGRAQLYLRRLDQFDAKPMAGTDGATGPFFSPDGKSIGFFAEGKLKRVAAAGGPPGDICDGVGIPTGGTWGEDNQIVFGSDFSGLLSVPATGGTPKSLTRPDIGKGEIGHIWPHALPRGRGVLFSILTEEARRIAVLSLETGQWQTLLKAGGAARHLPTGHLLYQESGNLLLVRFDLAHLTLMGEATSALQGLPTFQYAGEDHTGDPDVCSICPRGSTILVVGWRRARTSAGMTSASS